MRSASAHDLRTVSTLWNYAKCVHFTHYFRLAKLHTTPENVDSALSCTSQPRLGAA